MELDFALRFPPRHLEVKKYFILVGVRQKKENQRISENQHLRKSKKVYANRWLIISTKIWVTVGSPWDHFGVTLGVRCWSRFGVTLGSPWGHFGITLAWDHFGVTLWSLSLAPKLNFNSLVKNKIVKIWDTITNAKTRLKRRWQRKWRRGRGWRRRRKQVRRANTKTMMKTRRNNYIHVCTHISIYKDINI